jgi:hypothetical protein
MMKKNNRKLGKIKCIQGEWEPIMYITEDFKRNVKKDGDKHFGMTYHSQMELYRQFKSFFYETSVLPPKKAAEVLIKKIIEVSKCFSKDGYTDLVIVFVSGFFHCFDPLSRKKMLTWDAMRREIERVFGDKPFKFGELGGELWFGTR